MNFLPTRLSGLIEIEATPHKDARGSFFRAFCPEEFAAAGIDFVPAQTNISTNVAAGTLRGVHFQKSGHAEAKLVRAVSGRAFDVAVDLRPGPDFGKWHAVELSAVRMNAIFIPAGFGHGFMTLEPDTVLLYQMSPMFVPGFGAGLRWNDPALAIDWPMPPAVMSDADRGLPCLADFPPGIDLLA